MGSKMNKKAINTEDTPMNFDMAHKELLEILSKLQADEINVDTIPLLMQRAKFLSHYCEKWLKGIDEQIKEQIN